jgi:hypothetical protein
MTIKLFDPIPIQKNIIDACVDDMNFFIVAVLGRQVGKSTTAENLAIYWAINNPNSVVYWVSPTDSQAQKVYKDIVNAIYESGIIKSKKQGKGDIEIRFKNNSVLLLRSAASEDSLRGQSVDYMILDECAFIKRDTVEMILLPMLNVKGKKCLFITTPKGKNYIYEYYNKGVSGLNRWKSFRYSTLESPLANAELIEMFKKTLPEKLYKQEIEAEFIDSSSVFNNITELLCLDVINSPVNGVKYYAGIDIGLITDASVISILDDFGNLVKYYRFTDLESPELINEIIRICLLWKFEAVMIENNNQGLVIYQELKRKISNLHEFNTNSKTKPEIINRLIHLFNMREMKLIGDELLRIELEGFIFKQNDLGSIKFMADYGFSDDIVMSLAIARECYDNKRFIKKQFRIYH